MRVLAHLVVLVMPIISLAQDSKLHTQFVDCEKNEKGMVVASRELRTPVFTAKTGARVYGVVTATLRSNSLGPSCEYSSKIYLSKDFGEYQIVFEQNMEQDPDGTQYAGNGIQKLIWSPDGKYLIAEIYQWIDGADGDANRTKYVLIATDGTAAKIIHPGEKVYRSFAKECAGSPESTGWIDETHLGMLVKPLQYHNEEGEPENTPSCVAHPTSFSYDIATAKVMRMPAAKKQ